MHNLTNIGSITSSGTINHTGTINATQNVALTGYLQAYSYLYTRSDLRVLNAAGTGWTTWGSRSNGNYNLNVGTIAASGISTFQRDVRSAGMVRAAGWYNEAADTNYDDLAIEIGASGSTGYIISYDRDATQYYNMEIGALRHKFAVEGNNPGIPEAIQRPANYQS